MWLGVRTKPLSDSPKIKIIFSIFFYKNQINNDEKRIATIRNFPRPILVKGSSTIKHIFHESASMHLIEGYIFKYNV